MHERATSPLAGTAAADAPAAVAPPPWPDHEPVSTVRSTLHAWPPGAFDAHERDADGRLDARPARARTEPAREALDLCHPGLGLRAVLLVQAVLAVAVLAGARDGADWLARQGAAAFAGAAGTVAWLVVMCALQRPLAARARAVRAAAAVTLGALAALAAWWPLQWAGLAEGPQPWRVGGIAAAGAGFALLMWGWLEQRARSWQPVDAHARLAELQSRIRPHFLFNALNTALALVRVDPARAEAVLEDLAELFRVALAETRASVTLGDEVALARRYLAIEQIRFGERLAIEWTLDARADAARVPPLVLQPLVENAVRHGIEPALEGGTLRIESAVRRGQATLTVHNTLGGERSAPGHGIALENVRQRLALLHDVAGRCDTWADADGFHARITVPM